MCTLVLSVQVRVIKLKIKCLDLEKTNNIFPSLSGNDDYRMRFASSIN